MQGIPGSLQGIENGGGALVMRDSRLAFMRENGIPITRKNYIELNWMGDIENPDEPLDAELEASLPLELQPPEPR